MIAIFLFILLLLIIPLFVISIVANVRWFRMLSIFEENIDSCLDELDKKYGEISKILSRPVFYDSYEVKQVLGILKSSKDTILSLAHKVSNISFLVKQTEQEAGTEKKE